MTENELIKQLEYAVEEYCSYYFPGVEEVEDYWNLVRYFLKKNPNIVFNE